ncbi:PadR family transcriptional regulator [Arthrobacter sp. MMS18-M83]|uniref:PadR family transcriptional regulator n=1 Tax=Arthrobacter sp. MMS18-M83 TaxID=2996261 RepID=UPI00227D3F37|nr:PadR family transcriptional regulator [Arthrobacter sp. MMS18-M83]WAH97454.1 PadR family transcriptional regulator [Arthrobacter sp. MMS18-M83]
MKLEHILLGVLASHPSTGYDLKKFLDTRGRFMRSNTQMSQVYRSLTAMEKLGWVTYAVAPHPGAQDAKTYRVTEEGATVFLDWLTGPYQPPSRFQDPEFFARLRFAGFMSAEQVLRLLDMEINTRQEQIAQYRFRDRREHWAPTIPFDPELADSIGERIHHFGAEAIDAHVAAMIELRKDLLDGKLSSRSLTALPGDVNSADVAR